MLRLSKWTKEFIGKNKGGFILVRNSLVYLKIQLIVFLCQIKDILNKKILYAKKKSEIYTIENHSKMIKINI